MGIAVLMPVLNGAQHLPQQLYSLARQTHLPSTLIVSDDGSSDETRAVVRNFARSAPFEVILIAGPGRGYASNVMALLDHASNGAIAFCDQDDVWTDDRLARGMQAIGQRKEPAVHVVGRRALGRGRVGGDRRLPRPQCLFATALIQNLAPANATLINAPAAEMLRRAAGRLHAPPPFPDWWSFGLVAGCDGTILHDREAGVLYRETGQNVLGSVRSPAGMRRRLRYLYDGRFGLWLRQNTRALLTGQDRMTPDAQARLTAFATALEQRRTADWLALSDRRGLCEKMLLKLVANYGLI
jgi:glycosyltransferase involved in cell wall biosynthesis